MSWDSQDQNQLQYDQPYFPAEDGSRFDKRHYRLHAQNPNALLNAFNNKYISKIKRINFIDSIKETAKSLATRKIREHPLAKMPGKKFTMQNVLRPMNEVDEDKSESGSSISEEHKKDSSSKQQKMKKFKTAMPQKANTLMGGKPQDP